MKSVHIKFYKNVLWQFVMQALKYLLPFITLPYLTRILEPDGYAVYAYVLSLMTIVQVAVDFGFNLSGTRRTIELRDCSQRLSELCSAITVARLMISVVVFLGITLISFFVPILKNNIIYVCIAFFAAIGKSLLPDFVFQGFEDLRPLTIRYFIARGVYTVLIFVCVKSPDDLLLVAAIDLISGFVALAWSFQALKKQFGIILRLPSVSDCVKEIKFSVVYCISNVSSSLLSSFATIIIGIVITDQTQIAYWSLAITIIGAIQSLYTPIVNSLYPHMLVKPDYRFAFKLILLATPFLFIGTALYYALADTIVLILGGEQYLQGAYVLRMLTPILPLSFYAMISGWPILGARGEARKLTLTTISAGITNVAGLLAMAIFGKSNMALVCVIRCMSEGLMAAMRVFFCVLSFICSRKKDGEGFQDDFK